MKRITIKPMPSKKLLTRKKRKNIQNQLARKGISREVTKSISTVSWSLSKYSAQYIINGFPTKNYKSFITAPGSVLPKNTNPAN